MKIGKKIAVLSICALMGISAIGCTKNSSTSNEPVKKLVDVRTAGLVSDQDAILNFTTKNSNSSILSVELAQDEKENFIYTVNAIKKDGKKYIMTVDAKSGEVISEKENGVATADEKKNAISFVPVMDVVKAGKLATKASQHGYIQIKAYKLYAEGEKNMYDFSFVDDSQSDKDKDEDSSKPKVEHVIIDAITGDIISPKQEDKQ